jgi:hypothetical protein
VCKMGRLHSAGTKVTSVWLEVEIIGSEFRVHEFRVHKFRESISL